MESITVQRLIELEVTIERGLGTFVEVGNALLEIRDSRLYRDSHGTFEDYCRERWGMVASRARQLIAAAEVTSNLQSVTNVTLPLTESVSRPLVGLPAGIQREAWGKAVASAPNGKVTAAHVAAVAESYKPRSYIESEREPENRMAVMFSSETPEHYTPTTIVELVSECLSGIDLDPCSNSKEQPNVPAANHYTKTDDGLNAPWFGTVYMNPPYGREIDAWVEKLVNEYEAGEVTEAIALVPARTDTQWFRRFRNYHICFVEGRLTFIGNDDPAPFPSALVYLGANVDVFVNVFEEVGDIWHRTRHGYCMGE